MPPILADRLGDGGRLQLLRRHQIGTSEPLAFHALGDGRHLVDCVQRPLVAPAFRLVGVAALEISKQGLYVKSASAVIASLPEGERAVERRNMLANVNDAYKTSLTARDR